VSSSQSRLPSPTHLLLSRDSLQRWEGESSVPPPSLSSLTSPLRGCGVAYLAAVSGECISVINVLTLDVVWRRKGDPLRLPPLIPPPSSSGHVHSFASAAHDGQVLNFSPEGAEDKSLPVSQQLSSEGWLAACMTDGEDSAPQVTFPPPLRL
jgi:hypothetical protein